ncbi:YhgE/Pip domain-containing protein [Cellulomonas sp. zg-ZUI222]|uniref:YhgE/Pip domain-containing protein n=1 Tax=Cellulomonas wangleii TaxID=2816956 RepID=A0ABX8D908_9CELL|nr:MULTISPECIES: YhgE/Pip domain-containing protein [Cellulomonas]MBO0900437.1 YhgE/Pip domain-containing protein [Cellulomonas sp. zg-ZUI22]MBO0922733.1 YhgE/Pip domain-containing protein [Cellulomonas wangleii]MBO0926402.1 YhgE/Pip domain-containing protein [Cellulomonas wangleii]QVI63923.1 YhgE/Pip domain-containing protein [Cellulomonas wangleii]
MIIARLTGTELRRLAAGTLPKLALLALVVIPSLYSGLYLFANEDPYGRLDHVPAALVVRDRGATTTDPEDGSTRRVDYGQEVADRLADGRGGFRWVRTSQAEAEAGVRSDRFDAALIIGPSFSQDLVSSAEYRPQQASLTLVTNDANNYLSTTIADTIADDVRDAIATQVGTQAATVFLQGFGSIHTNLAQGVQGADRLVDGAGELATGTAELVGGTGRLAWGAQEASRGAAELAGGLDTLRADTRGLPDATRRLAAGAAKVAAGDDEIERVATQVEAAAARATAEAQAAARAAEEGARRLEERRGTDEGQDLDAALLALDDARAVVQDQLNALQDEGYLTPEQVQALTDPVPRLEGELASAQAALHQATTDLRALDIGAREVAQGDAALAEAAPRLAQGIASAAAGAGRLSSGTAQVSQGAEELAISSVTLHNGTNQLASGVTELRDGLQSGLERIPDLDQQTERDTARTIGDPVRVADDQLARAGSYGAGLAPFFMSLATWIGGYVLFLLVRPLSQRALAAGAPAWRTALGGWLPAVVLGAGQVVLMTALVAFALDIRPVYGAYTVLLLLLASAAFIAVLQALNVWFGAVGEFLGLVLMLVQLVTAGGTFPWQTIPEPLLSVHRLLPMSYTVDGLRQTLYGGDLASAAGDAAVLAGVLVLGLAATTWAAYRRRTWTPNRLQPELVL